MRLECLLSRDKVAADEDGEPHGRSVTVELAGDVADEVEPVLLQILDSGYLPRVAGPACWGAVSGLPLALVVGRSDLLMLRLPAAQLAYRLDRRGDALRVHFAYFAATPPEIARRVMQSILYPD